MIRRSILILVLLASANVSIAQSVLGAGGLTVRLNESGVMTGLAWPGAGGPNQIRARTGETAPTPGIRWWLRDGAGWVPQDDARWLVHFVDSPNSVLIEFAERNGPARVLLNVSLELPEGTLLLRWEGWGIEEPPGLRWTLDLAPRTKLIPEWRDAAERVAALSDFAALALSDTGTVVQFRPESPGKSDWGAARDLTDGPHRWDAWSGFREGIWLAYSTLPKPTALGLNNPIGGTVPDSFDGAVSSNAVRVGPASGEIWVDPQPRGERWVAELVLNAGPDSGVYSALTQWVSNRNWDSVESLKGSGATGDGVVARPNTESFEAYALQVVRASQDSRTGAVVSHGGDATGDAAADAVSDPIRTAFVAPALLESDFSRPAFGQLEFLMQSMRHNGGRLDAALYFDTSPASPRWRIDPAPAAWFLWSLAYCAEQLPVGARQAFLQRWRADWEGAADFLAGWTDPRTGMPLGTPGVERDSGERLATSYLGMVSALKLSEMIQEAAPDAWDEFKRDLYDLIGSILDLNKPNGSSRSLLPILLSGYPTDSAVVLPFLSEKLGTQLTPTETAQAYAALVLVSRSSGTNEDLDRMLKQTEELAESMLRGMDTGALATALWARHMRREELVAR